MILSKSCQYGIRALLYVAMESDKSRKTELVKIAEALDIPKPYLAKIMQQMVKRGLARSAKGPHGGFYMTPKENSKNLLDVIEAIDGLGYFTQCGLGMEECDMTNPCPIHAEIVKIREKLMKTFGKYTVQKISEQIKEGKFVITLK